MSQPMKMTTLNTAWTRLEAVARKLWDENSANAVETQAVIEEFKGEVHRIDAYLTNAGEMHSLEQREHESDLAAMRRHYELELAGVKKRLELLEGTVREKEARIDDLMKTLARKEEENVNFHSQLLRVSASSDEVKTKKMEEFYQELMKKESNLAESWQQRHVTLEHESENRQKVLTARQTELEAWENRRLTEEEALLKRTTDLEIKSQQLSQEYRKKQQEIEDLKANLQRSITDLVRQYQSRLHGPADAAPVTSAR
jgi:chromosome segregation ATPase